MRRLVRVSHASHWVLWNDPMLSDHSDRLVSRDEILIVTDSDPVANVGAVYEEVVTHDGTKGWIYANVLEDVV